MPARQTKSGEPHKGDLKAIANYEANKEAFVSRLERRKLPEFGQDEHRQGCFDDLATDELIDWDDDLLSGRTKTPPRNGRIHGHCKFCPHKQVCINGLSPDPQDYYTRQPDYVDEARKEQQDV